MNGYSISLFLHVVGALGFFIALGLEWTSLRQLQHATTMQQVRAWMRLSSGIGRVGMISMVLLLGSGIYMMATVWGGVAWIIVTLGTLVPLAVLALAVSGRRMTAIGQAVSTESGPLSPTLRQMLHHPLLWMALQTRVAVALGIVFLMTVKPDLSRSLLTIGVAAITGLISAWPMWLRGQPDFQEAQNEI